MANEFDEFAALVGREVPIYRSCRDCGDTIIADPGAYDKPKTVCDPGYCNHTVPFCICEDTVLYSKHAVERCTYPECPRAPTHEDDDDEPDMYE